MKNLLLCYARSLQLALLLVPVSVMADDEVTEKLSPTCDTYLRYNNTSNYSTAPTLELYTTRDENGEITADFVGLMSFEVPAKSGYTVSSATLHVVTERAKGSINIYKFTGTASDSDTYATQAESITSTRATTPLVRSLTLKGTSGKAVTDSGASNTLSDWENDIDLTGCVQGIGSGTVNLLFENAAQSTSTSVKVYTSDATDVTNSNENFTFKAGDLKPYLLVVYEVDTGSKTTTGSVTGDTYVRYGNTTDHGEETTMEIYTNSSSSMDFVGLMAFSIPEAAVGNVTSATLRLVTERCKGERNMNIYPYGNAFEEFTTYATETEYIAAARKKTPVKFEIKYGMWNKALTATDDVIDASYSDIIYWTNTVDITSIAKAATSTTFQIMVCRPADDTNSSANKFFTKEITDFTHTDTGGSYEYSASDLVPQLTIVYSTEESTDTGVVAVDTDVTAASQFSSATYNLAGQKVGDDYKGIVIIDGKKYLRK